MTKTIALEKDFWGDIERDGKISEPGTEVQNVHLLRRVTSEIRLYI
jgi:hypothetical protein